ncbi:hypothetical protein OESDEN_18574 [Oesophagostomum dentatum]|uniref:Uncharacterized protein n=1 Tax=Oesophagostomum dentatum TaxID=61180 RepID=A0A0B1S8X4_OESDE|nr:hypothetical protein OESDEN_18574 [Oesophagostomum dentatum]
MKNLKIPAAPAVREETVQPPSKVLENPIRKKSDSKKKSQNSKSVSKNRNNQENMQKTRKKGTKEAIMDAPVIIASNADTEKDEKTMKNLKIAAAPAVREETVQPPCKVLENTKKSNNGTNSNQKELKLVEWSTLEDYKTEQEN